MPLTFLPELRLYAEISGPMFGPPVVFLPGLGS